MTAAPSARRALIVTNGWPTERHPEYAVFNARQVAALRDLGLEVDVAFVNGRDLGKAEYLRWLPRLRARARDADIVHCYHGLTFLLTTLGLVRKPLVVSFQNAVEHEYAELPRPLRPIAERASRHLLGRGTCGAIFKDRVPDWMRGDPLARYIANGVDMEQFRPGDRAAARAALGLDADAVYLLFVSSKDLMRPQKRYDRFEQVLQVMRTRHPDRRIEAMTLVQEPAERVKLFYQAADVHVMTSAYEGSPNSVKEAMASGLPVVSSDVGNVRRMAGDAAAIRVLDAFSPEAFCDAIEAMLATDASAREGLRDRLRAEGLDGETAAGKVAALYEDVLARSG